MSTPAVSPLGVEHLSQIRNALDVIQNAKGQLELAKRAGIDVADQEDQIKQAETRLLQIKQVYFPGM